jgi:hypothetical protein
MDLGQHGGSDARQVWNHAVYQYRLSYTQPDPTDLRVVHGELVLHANLDSMRQDRSSSGAPAVAVKSGGVLRPVQTPWAGRLHRSLFKARFTASGKLDLDWDDAGWFFAVGKNGELDPEPDAVQAEATAFAPRLAARLFKPTDTAYGLDGNWMIQREHVLALLELRARYA